MALLLCRSWAFAKPKRNNRLVNTQSTLEYRAFVVRFVIVKDLTRLQTVVYDWHRYRDAVVVVQTRQSTRRVHVAVVSCSEAADRRRSTNTSPQAISYPRRPRARQAGHQRRSWRHRLVVSSYPFRGQLNI